MSSSPGYEALGVAPGDSFNVVLDAFQARAKAILQGDFAATALADWRVACESLDWISKQPGVRQIGSPR